MRLASFLPLVLIAALSACSQPATPTDAPVAVAPLPSVPPAPTSTSVPATATLWLAPTPIPSPTEIVPGAVLFEEDFEDGTADNFVYIVDGWMVTTEENGNRVFEIDRNTEEAIKNNEGAGVGFGLENWTNFSAEYRVRMLNAKGNSWLSFRNTRGIYYVEWLSAEWDSFNLFFNEPHDGWQNIKSLELSVRDERWYRVKVEAQGPELRVYLDDALMIQVEDERIANGDFNLGVFPGTHALFDDIRVIALGEAP